MYKCLRNSFGLLFSLLPLLLEEELSLDSVNWHLKNLAMQELFERSLLVLQKTECWWSKIVKIPELSLFSLEVAIKW